MIIIFSRWSSTGIFLYEKKKEKKNIKQTYFYSGATSDIRPIFLKLALTAWTGVMWSEVTLEQNMESWQQTPPNERCVICYPYW